MIRSAEEEQKIEKELENADFHVAEVRKGERTQKSPLPFTTSTLQQEASKVLNFATQKTMRIAQQLYEGIDIKGQGTVGIITYLRTDSTRVSEEAERHAREYISSVYGAEYVADTEKKKDGGKNIRTPTRQSVLRIFPEHRLLSKSLFRETSSACIS